MYTWNDIQGMSNEELAAANAELGKEAAKNIAGFFLIKLGILLAVGYLANKFWKKYNQEQETK